LLARDDVIYIIDFHSIDDITDVDFIDDATAIDFIDKVAPVDIKVLRIAKNF
jgi:hypothetical protein